MPEQLRCPQGHQWEAELPPPGESLLSVPCPVCGVAVARRPSYLLEGGDSLANSPPRHDARPSSAPTRVVPDLSRSPRSPHRVLESTEFDLPQIKGYSILRELGRGGMGVVYLAAQDGLDRFVALKMIIPREDSGPDDLVRFKTEAAAVSRVQHPNLVNVYEVGELEGQPYIALEFVEGGNLDDKLGGKPQPPLEAAKLAETLARAMHAAHQKGLVHRDLKPANVLLTADGIPKITDFGLVRRQDRGGKPQTQTGIIMGTPNYMAPEQASGSAELIGPKTDVYALGAMLYEFLTGRPPFMADDGWDTILQVVSDEPVPPSQLNHKVPRDLERICLKCLEKEPERRYESAEALADDLARFLRNEPIHARMIGPHERLWKWTRRHPALAGMFVTIALALGALLFMASVYHLHIQQFAEQNRQRVVHLSVHSGVQRLDEGDCFGGLLWFTEALDKDQHDAARAAVHRMRIAAVLKESPQLVQVLFHAGPVRFVSFSHDGRFLVTASADQTAQIWEVDTGRPRGAALHHDDTVFQAWFSPDDQTVLTASKDGTARLWAAETGKPRSEPLRHGKAVVYASFSPDGRHVVTAGDTEQAIVWDARSGRKLDMVLQHSGRVNYACFSPDGRWLATTGEDGAARIWDAASGKHTATVRHEGPVTFASFGPGPQSELLVTASADATARVWKVPSGEPQTPPLQHNEMVNSALFSPDGTQIITTSNDDTAKLWDARTGRLLTLPMQHGSDVRRFAAFSPDRRWVATGSDDNTARVWSTVSGQQMMTRLRHNGTVYCTAFSPKNLLLATASDDHSVRVWNLSPLHSDVVQGAGETAATKPTSTPLDVAAPPLPPLRGLQVDGDRVFGTNLVTKMPYEKKLLLSDPSAGAKLSLDYATLSLDGQLLATIQEGRQVVCVWDANTGAPKSPPLQHSSSVTNVRFNSSGNRLLTCGADNTARIWSVPAGELVAPPLRHHGTVIDAAFSPDSSKVVTASRDKTARVWDAVSGEPITPALAHPHFVEEAFFSADGTKVTTRDSEHKERHWILTAESRSVGELMNLAEVLSGRRIEGGVSWPIEPQAFRDAWRTLRSKYPDALGTWKRQP